MTSVSEHFQSLRQAGQCALIPFITAGDPDLETTEKAIKILDESGADFIELGVPYSDPLADGPTIQAAATRALSRGVTLENVLGIVKRVSPTITAPIILFTYYNPIFYRGVAAFMQQVAAAGVKGLVIPDLPLEESDAVLAAATANSLELTLLVAPTSPNERIEAIAKASQGFIYLVSVTGVTGARTSVASRVEELLPKLRAVTDKPVGVGFGVSDPDQAKLLRDWGADGVIVGSAIVKRLASGTPAEGLQAVKEFCESLKGAIA
ncbi:tryptophan synthase subunit alpha [[Limnothrix rosea] IAM M-220]|uniref:tryptophan synthase subunit alpha n=1 Tax=[Limnothrix rosea] IAM M-220 TaxID=454133 RepID=UPI000964B943|nr:tryptophan synthase subunit alpha [[Limnothrix rosea] IAM M-220]OKH16034.1 tryptophan synthase subunit alpha [[Limnothrix rosea] IAM M-220]